LRKGQDNKKQNRYLEEAERRQFDIGKSDLFRVNIRELSSAEARMLEIDAIAEFYRSLAEYYAALGIDPSGRAFEKSPH
jgi:outer membrane protein TolC